MSNGPLTQTIAAATVAADHILSLSNLPPEADTLKNTATEFNTSLRPQLLEMQSRVLATAGSATTALTGVQTDIIDNKGVPDPTVRTEIVRTLTSVQAELVSLVSMTKAADLATDEYYEKVTAGSRILSALSGGLDAQRNGMQMQLQSAQAEVASIKDKMKYYGILGLAGLPGLIAMGVLLSKANDNVNEASGRVRTLDNQILQIDQTLLAVRAMQADFQNLSTSTLSVKNATEFVFADVDHALSDVEHSTGPIAILYITTALNELQTLANDAS
ncbi:hypothetical protein [Rhizobium sp. Leaf262]|uniref:hypothetical protein n=1 Tax=Rhizobium sp. Leaf262 TaxID=1736312 RepID=UPI0012E935A7|nr:hypothetical protein [Rhizobium sp. Leaf262]